MTASSDPSATPSTNDTHTKDTNTDTNTNTNTNNANNINATTINAPVDMDEPACIYQTDKLLDAAKIKRDLQSSLSLPVYWIRDLDALELCLDDLETCERVALDTEFIKRNTYYPRLALIQINTGKCIYLIDAPKLDLSEFWVVLEEMPLMVWHACSEDLGIFYLLSDAPPLTNVFDTQIALAFLTGRMQMGYQQALDTQLDIQVAKGESRSDWLARPLTHEQEQYAVDDVRYLLVLHDILHQQLSKQKLLDKVHEECQLYATELYEMAYVEDDATYLPMADYRYDGTQLAVLQAVSAWREELARATNQPKTFLLKKQAMREVVTELPTSIKQLHNKTSMHRSIIRIYGDELLGVIKKARQLDDDDQPASITAPYRSKDKTLAKLMQAAVKEYAQTSGIPAGVLMRKKWLACLYEVVAYELPIERLPEGLLGWRKPWVTQTLIPLLEEHKEQLQIGMGIIEADDDEEEEKD